MVKMLKNKKVFVFLLILILIFTLSLLSCRREDSDEIRTFEAIRGDITQTVTANGNVEAATQKNYSVQAAGEILLALEKGDVFKKGDILFEIDNSRTALAVLQAEENINLAKSALEQARIGYKQGLESNHIAVQMAQLNNELAQRNAENALVSLRDAQRLADRSSGYGATTVSIAKVSLENAQIAIEDSGQSVADAEKRVEDAKNALADAKQAALPDIVITTLEASLANAEASLGAAEAQVKNLEAAYRSAEAQLLSAQAAYDQAKAQSAAQVHSAEAAIDQVQISQSMTYWSTLGETQYAANQIRLARESINQAEFQINLAEIGLEMAKLDLDKNAVIAPFDGMVYAAPFSVGEYAAPGMSVLSVISEEFIIYSNIDETDIVKLQIGQEVDFSLDAYFGEIFKGEISYISPIADIVAGIVNFRIEIIPKESDKLLYGLSANLTIITDKAEDVILAPPDSVYTEDGREYVDLFVNGEILPVAVETGVISFDYIEIRSGVQVGDKIIMDRF
jgi:HlyD family secretion protein